MSKKKTQERVVMPPQNKIEKIDASGLENIDEDQLEAIYGWVDELPLTRTKRNITRDFSDGGMVAEIIKACWPGLVRPQNFPPANSVNRKKINWYHLNTKVFKQLNFELLPEVIDGIVNCRPLLIEKVLSTLRTKIDTAIWEIKRKAQQERQLQHQVQAHGRGGKNQRQSDKPEADQNMASVSPRRKQEQGPRSTFQQKKKTNQGYDNCETVSKLLVEEKEQELLAKGETILILQAKVQRLEHLLYLKDMRIEDLQKKLEQMRPTGLKG